MTDTMPCRKAEGAKAWLWQILAGFCLSACTAVVMYLVERHEPVGENLVRFPNGYAGSNLCISASEREVKQFRIPVEGVHPGESVQVSAVVKSGNVEAGARPWETARVVFLSYGPSGVPLYGTSHLFYNGAGREGERRLKKVFSVADEAVSTYVEFQINHVTGELCIGQLEVKKLRKSGTHGAWVTLLSVTWLILASGILFMNRGILKRHPGMVALALVLAALLLMPGVEKMELYRVLMKEGQPFSSPETVFRAAHFIGFLLLAAVTTRVPLAERGSLSILIAALVAVAVSTEALQFLVPGRSPRISDLALNLTGVLAGVSLSFANVKNGMDHG